MDIAGLVAVDWIGRTDEKKQESQIKDSGLFKGKSNTFFPD